MSEYHNPTPVVACLIPLEDSGYVGIIRNIEPAKGGIAFPGGYVDEGESAEEAASRECWEELSFESSPEDWTCLKTLTNQRNNMIIFVKHRKSFSLQTVLSGFAPNREVSRVLRVQDPQDLAFPLHAKMLVSILCKDKFKEPL